MKKSILSFLSFMMMVSSPKVAYSQSLGEVIVGIGTGLLSGAICRELGASRDLQAFCAIGGALIGASAAREMNRQDAKEFNRAQEEAFQGDLHRHYEWDAHQHGSRSGVRGRIVVIEEGYHHQTREICRVYKNRTYFGRNQMEEKTSTVCQRSDGRLYTLENTTYYRRGRVVSSETYESESYARNRRPVPRPRPPVYEPEPVPPVGYCDGWSARNLRMEEKVYTRQGTVVYYQGYNNYDNTVVVRTGRHTQVLNLNDIAIAGCHYGLQVGTRVSTRRGFSGSLIGIFMNSDVAIRSGGYIHILNRHEIYR